MPFFSEEELLALSACPPSGTLANDPAPIDAVEERITLHREALDGPVTYIVSLCCDEMVANGVALQKIERHLRRLVNKELKGTGVALAQIANFLQIIATTNIGENINLLTQIQQNILFGEPIQSPAEEEPDERPIDPFSQAPETTPTPEILDPQDSPFGAITPRPLVPGITPPPEFPPETSTAVGGSTFAAPQPRGPTEEEIAAVEDKGTWLIPDETIIPPVE